jgi:hypothetical protein
LALGRGSKPLASLGVLAALVFAPPSQAQQESPLTTIYMPQGGKIVYGKVEGADSQGAAMKSILRSLHENFGDKPKIGKVFRMRGTDSVGVFFTVVNHPAGDVPVAGLIIAANSRPHEAQAALVWDRADHLAQSINPMLDRLSGAWHPGGAASTAAGGSAGAPAGSAAPAPAPPSGYVVPSGALHRVAAADGSTTTLIPEGWTMDRNSGHGTMVVAGPNGETVGMGMQLYATDPLNPNHRGQPRVPGMLYYPYRGDIAASYQELVQAWRSAMGRPPLRLEVEQLKRLPSQPGEAMSCVSARGRMDPDGHGMRHYGDLLCASLPGSWGIYSVTLDRTMVPVELAEKEDRILRAIHENWKIDFAVVKQQSDAAAAQMQANTQAMIAQNHQRAHAIEEFGQSRVAQMKDVQRQHDEQNRSFEQGQEDISRRGQGFSNYVLDQTVIRDIQDPDTHATVWNRTAESMMRAYPDRVEEVPTSQYIQGQDF